MNVQQRTGFYVVGIAARTNNAAEMNGNGKIAGIWHTLLRDNLAVKIPNKLGVDLVAVYTDYENNHNGDYTYLLGLPVSSIENVPAKFIVKHIPAGRYAVLSSNRGPIAEIVPEAWRRIWSMSSEELGGTRSFRADYEIYDQRVADPERAQIEIYVGLR
jgi:predicted transcriptional regulator YdeE